MLKGTVSLPLNDQHFLSFIPYITQVASFDLTISGIPCLPWTFSNSSSIDLSGEYSDTIQVDCDIGFCMHGTEDVVSFITTCDFHGLWTFNLGCVRKSIH